jgi:hypothetical protein
MSAIRRQLPVRLLLTFSTSPSKATIQIAIDSKLGHPQYTTILLPIHQLALPVGQAGNEACAWLRPLVPAWLAAFPLFDMGKHIIIYHDGNTASNTTEHGNLRWQVPCRMHASCFGDGSPIQMR